MTSVDRIASTYEGGSLDDALSRACAALRSRVGELRYEVVSEGEDGVTIEADVDPEAVLGLFLSEVFRAAGLALVARLQGDGDGILQGDIVGDDLGVLTDAEGRGLDALQYLCNRVLDRRLVAHPPVHLDADGYKEKRARRLQERARSAANAAAREDRRIALPPLTPAARRDVHLALADDRRVDTISEGDGFMKRVVVVPRAGGPRR